MFIQIKLTGLIYMLSLVKLTTLVINSNHNLLIYFNHNIPQTHAGHANRKCCVIAKYAFKDALSVKKCILISVCLLDLCSKLPSDATSSACGLLWL